MKKLILTIVALVGLMLPASAVDWTAADVNIALGKPVTVSHNQKDGAKITDGNDRESWQSNVNHNENPDAGNEWVVIDLLENRDITDFQIKFQAAHPKEYSVYLIPSDVEIDNISGYVDNWVQGEALFSETLEGENDITSDVMLENKANGRYFLIYITAYNNWAMGYGSNIFEVRIANIENREVYTNMSIGDWYGTEGDIFTVQFTATKASGDPSTDWKGYRLSLTSNNETALTIEEGDAEGTFTVTANTLGTYTLTATATPEVSENGEGILTATAEVVVNYPWTDTNNLAISKAVAGRISSETAVTPNPYSNATDGSTNTYYEFDGGYGGGEGWVLLDLNGLVDIEAISVLFDNSRGGDFGISYSAEETVEISNSTVNMKDKANRTGFTDVGGFITRRKNNQLSSYYPEETISARYILIWDNNNPDEKPRLAEIYVAGQREEVEREAASIVLATEADHIFVGDQMSYTLTVLDQFGDAYVSEEFPDIILSNAELLENSQFKATTNGVITLQAKLGDLESDIIKIYSANEDHYCLENAKFSTDTEKEDFKYLIDGGKYRNAQGSDIAFEIVGNDTEEAGEHEHWLLIELNEEHDLDKVILLWEGACAGSYELLVGNDIENLSQVFTVSGRGQSNWVDHIYGDNMKNVKYIKMHSTVNATQWGIKLFDLKAYGVPSSTNYYLYGDMTVNSEGNPVEYNPSYKFTASSTEDGTYTLEVASVQKDQTFVIQSNNGVTFYTTSDEEVWAGVIPEVADGKVCNVYLTTNADNGYKMKFNAAYANLTFTFTPGVDGTDGNLEIDGTLISSGVVVTPGNDKTEQSGTVTGTEIQLFTLNETAAVFVYSESPIYYYTTNEKSTKEVRAREGEQYTAAHYDTKYSSGAYMIGLPVDSTGTLVLATKNDDSGEYVSAGEYTYTVTRQTPTGVESFGAENESMDVYNLQGICVKKNIDSLDAVKELPSGIYIVGGKKVVIR